ncbi:elongation factor G [Companilactobacillus ginsenosidimutans]|uniref:Elongation factor G n=1 Tax=Companilactobacillus ginsenosidimutans TaxID=1007676 RepID=A0A0H4QE41_9LACO|nr:TetM/TetW/TetO/TetS family tetracycline resistance ribosomal protection protein [Companilactobacillus ginsenosidimutans]AKP66634.1 elongation factor G [Companilactobacillus ginsenosidimutans]
MKDIITGIVAHVDAGKTTLSESMLFDSGEIRNLGRVDNGDAFLDSDALEKKRGITIFSHQAEFQYKDMNVTLLDTPGHIDFVSQTEQVLQVLDYAILVVSATDGIQGHTRTLWRLLDKYQVPTFIFINKADANTAELSNVMDQLQNEFSTGCIAFASVDHDVQEEISLQDDAMVEQFLENDGLSDTDIQTLINQRKIFPCFTGSALKNTGITEFLDGLNQWTTENEILPDFAAKVFKVTHDHGERLSWIRVYGGSVKTKSLIYKDEKVNQIRIYNGEKYNTTSELKSNQVGAVTGLTKTFPGLALGNISGQAGSMIQPVLSYQLNSMDNEINTCLTALNQLNDENPQLNVKWNNDSKIITISVMGVIQLEILKQIMLERFDLSIDFDQGRILYKETISKSVEAVGHFEPLRHYAEVHLLLEPGERGSGITIASSCSQDVLPSNWQHQVLSNLSAKQHLGVLVGAPLTDIKITLINGRGSNVHSVGGDFRQATWRAVRQGLMMLQEQSGNVLLEPWYRFKLIINQNEVGRAMNDIQKMHGELDPLNNVSTYATTTLTGRAPVSEMADYAQEVREYTHGQGDLECIIDGFFECHDTEKVVQEINYNPVSDLENTPDSVFCAHGAGYPVPWNEVPEMAHVPYQKV